MSRFVLLALCATATFANTKPSKLSPLQYGMSMATRAFEIVCWYESLKVFPYTYSQQFGKCNGQAEHVQAQVEYPVALNKKYMGRSDDNTVGLYGKLLGDLEVLDTLPNSKHFYKARCAKFLKAPKADTKEEENVSLNDNSTASYPYKALAYCLISGLRDRHGSEAIQAVESEKTHSHKDWMQTIFDRENEFRARHGVEPLYLNKELTDAAQSWSETMARECKMYHSKNKARQYYGASVGENLAASEGNDESQDASYLAIDGFYEEIKDYPFPKGYQGNGKDALLKKIGHFTQSIWVGSQTVGYGYAYNQSCAAKGKFTRYLTARYLPAGNIKGKFQENVKPPII